MSRDNETRAYVLETGNPYYPAPRKWPVNKETPTLIVCGSMQLPNEPLLRFKKPGPIVKNGDRVQRYPRILNDPATFTYKVE
jgi:hypothetical protein